jgi:diguanylate cyclase (GGDEF)-like protein
MNKTSNKLSEHTLRLDKDQISLALKNKMVSRTASFIVMGGINVGDSILLNKIPFILGRDPSCDYVVKDTGISRIHAKITLNDEKQYVIEDLNSTNGIFAEGARIERHVLKEGDKILLGRQTVLKFVKQDIYDQKYQQQLYESTVKDGLTGIYNRKHFNERIVSELSFATRHKTALSLLMFDLDYFKKINDTFGHQAGDLTLISVTKAVKKTLREEDFFARYGGEEFIIIARDIGLKGAMAFGERIRKIIEKEQIIYDNNTKIPVTVSIGVTTLLNGKSIDATSFLKAVDANLYKAKQNGRNRVIASALV